MRRSELRCLLRIMRRIRRGPDIPARPAPIAQPEDAGLRIGWMLHRVADLYLLTAMEPGALDRMAIAQRPLIERPRPRPSAIARPSRTGLGEARYVSDPSIDGPSADIELVQSSVGGAGQAGPS